MKQLALRDRLAVSFTLALVLAYVMIALVAVIVVDRTLRGSVDSRLSTVAQAIVTIAGDERDEVDHKDRQQFSSITADASGAVVLDAQGNTVLSTTNEIPDWLPRAVRNARIGQLFTTDNEGHEIRALVERRRKHATSNVVVVWQLMQVARDLERTLGVVLGVFGVVVAAGGFAIGAQIARRGLLPLTRITAIVADIAANDLSARVGSQPHADELGRLAATFDQMLDRLQSAFERQRRFTADASHDLRAPLATLRAEVELALRRERTTAEYRAALEEIALDADHLDRLIDALLAAARADSGELDLRPLDLRTIANVCVDAIAPFARAKTVTIDADLAVSSAIVGDEDLLGRAVLATLHNAVKYTPPGRSIHVHVEHVANNARLSIHDEGPGFSDLALTHAFDRFWRDDNARGRSGSGLGLAIAQGIVQRCGGEITIENAPAGGARVLLCFPLTATSPASIR